MRACRSAVPQAGSSDPHVLAGNVPRLSDEQPFAVGTPAIALESTCFPGVFERPTWAWHMLQPKHVKSSPTTRWVSTYALLMILPASGAAQTPSSDLTVSVTVPKSCTVSVRADEGAQSTSERAEAEELVSVECAKGATPARPRISMERSDLSEPVATDHWTSAEPQPDVVVVNF